MLRIGGHRHRTIDLLLHSRIMTLPKNKALTFFLLVVVIGLWATILYKFFARSTPALANQIPAKTKISDELSDSFTISDYSRDPFLSILDDTAVQLVKDSIVKAPVQPREQNVTLPKYCGIIENAEGETCILKTTTGYVFLKKGERSGNIKLQKINKENVVINLDNISYTIGISTTHDK